MASKQMKFWQSIIFSANLYIASIFSLSAQYANDWISFNKTYYKIELKREGIYRLTYQNLISVNFPVGQVDPINIQMFFRGQEIPIRVVDRGASDIIDEADYIEFYGIGNDNALDKALYQNQADITNPYETLYSDRTAYFLTFSRDGTLGLRIQDAPTAASTPQVDYYKGQVILSEKNPSNFAFGTVYPTNLQTTNIAAFDANWSSAKGFTGAARGFFTHDQSNQIKVDHTLNITNYYYDAADQPSIKVFMTGRSHTQHTVEIWVGTSANNQRKVGTLQFGGFENGLFETALNESDFPTNDGQLVVSYVLLRATPANYEFVSLSAIEVNYPKTLDMQNQPLREFMFYNNRVRATINNALNNATTFLIVDSMQVKNISTTEPSAGQVTFSVASESTKPVKVHIQSIPSQPISIQRVTLSPIDTQKNYLILTHSTLLSGNAVANYANYRASVQGGSFNTDIQTVEHLYNQFTYGEVSPLAFRRYATYMIEQGNPAFLFIIGRGLDVLHRYEHNRPASESWGFKSLVPAYSFPPSDFAITEGLNGLPNVPAIPTGRLCATNTQQIVNYFNKVKEHEESLPSDLWHKRFLHLTGGKTNAEQERFASFGISVGNIAENKYMGAQITPFKKGGLATAEIIRVSDQLNEGVGLIYMFGHSSTTFTDFSVGNVSNDVYGYNNQGKYPFMLVNGCNAGNVFQRGNDTRTLGEDWVLTPNRGAIAFMAHSYFAFDLFQAQYNNSLYTTFYADSAFIYRPIGESVQKAIERFAAINSNNISALSNAQQFVLQGDPAVRIFNAPNPDYMPDQSGIYVLENESGNRVNAQNDFFQIILPISNFGRVDIDSVTLRVKRTFPNGTIQQVSQFKIAPVFYRDSISIKIKQAEKDREIAVGDNIFTFIIDPENAIPELRTTNNIATYKLFLPRSGLSIVKPYRYSIANKAKLSVYMHNSDFLERNRNYIFQLDTSVNFQSAAFTQGTARGGNTTRWQVTLPVGTPGDTIAYYLRGRYASEDLDTEDDTAWINTTFSYIPESNTQGWAQVNLQQLNSNNFKDLSVDAPKTALVFDKKTVSIQARTIGDNGSNPDRRKYAIIYNGLNITQEGLCNEFGNNRILMIAFDQTTGRPYIPLEIFNTPVQTCGLLIPQAIILGLRDQFIRLVDPNLGNDLALNINAVKNGDYVFLMAIGNNKFQLYDDRQFNALATIGIDITQFKMLESGDPFIALGIKGGVPGSALTAFPSQILPINERTVQGDFSFSITETSGTITTPFIGPAQNWQNMLVRFKGKDTSADRREINIYGFDNNKQNSLLLAQNITANQYDVSGISANTYPYLQIQITLADTVNFSPLQFDKWLINFEETPEGILSFHGATRDREGLYTLEEGDSLRFEFIFRNISESAVFSDPLIVAYNIDNQAPFYDTLTSLNGSDSLLFNLTLSSVDLVGKHLISANINPRIQVEKSYDDNFLEYNFMVHKDSTHPVLDVVFDGRHIMDGEIISSSPVITVSVADDNDFLIIDDTNHVNIFMKRPEVSDFQEISFSNKEITWEQVAQNDFRVYYRPENMTDGQYALKVQASDVTGNKSGTEPYQVNFEVVNEASITHFYPYPNPFSDQVRFVFTLTGTQAPEELKIQIMTISGRVVREITQDEIGTVHVGHNISEYAWDGTDEYGDQLANGVYLYRVITQIDGQPIRQRETSKDNLFKHGIGKMYLIK